MRRDLRGAIVEKIEHRVTKRTGVIRLDKRSMTFFAREDDANPLIEPFASKNGAEVKNWLKTQLSHTTVQDQLEWIPVIRIENDSEPRHRYRDQAQLHGEKLDVDFERFYVALTRDEREWRRLPWEACNPDSTGFIEENDRYAQSHRHYCGPKHDSVIRGLDKPFRLPSFDGDKATVKYTPELWQGLLLILKQITGARETLTQMIGTKSGIETVAEIGAGKTPLLLAAPAKGE